MREKAQEESVVGDVVAFVIDGLEHADERRVHVVLVRLRALDVIHENYLILYLRPLVPMTSPFESNWPKLRPSSDDNTTGLL